MAQMVARYAGICATCGRGIEPGDMIDYDRTTRTAMHVTCPAPVQYRPESGKTWWHILIPSHYADLVEQDIPTQRIDARTDRDGIIDLRVHRVDYLALKPILAAWPYRPASPSVPLAPRPSAPPTPARPASAPRRNTRPDRCDVCGRLVEPGQGYLRRCLGGSENCAIHDYSDTGGWHVTHIACAGQ